MPILQIVLFVVFLAGAVVGLALRRSGGAAFVPLGLASALVQATTFGIKNVMLQVAAILVFVACMGVVFWNGRHAPWRAVRLDIILGVGSILCIVLLQTLPGMTVEASQILLALLFAFGLGFVGRMFYVAFQLFRAAYRL